MRLPLLIRTAMYALRGGFLVRPLLISLALGLTGMILAISPAVNDPSTAINCVDQLTRILIRWVGRAPPANLLSDPPHVVRVIIPWIDFDHLLDTTFEQIRHYAVNDIAVSLRLLRALSDLAATTDDEPMCERLVLRGRRIVAGCATWVDANNSKRLGRRLAELEARAPTTTLT